MRDASKVHDGGGGGNGARTVMPGRGRGNRGIERGAVAGNEAPVMVGGADVTGDGVETKTQHPVTRRSQVYGYCFLKLRKHIQSHGVMKEERAGQHAGTIPSMPVLRQQPRAPSASGNSLHPYPIMRTSSLITILASCLVGLLAGAPVAAQSGTPFTVTYTFNTVGPTACGTNENVKPQVQSFFRPTVSNFTRNGIACADGIDDAIGGAGFDATFRNDRAFSFSTDQAWYNYPVRFDN